MNVKDFALPAWLKPSSNGGPHRIDSAVPGAPSLPKTVGLQDGMMNRILDIAFAQSVLPLHDLVPALWARLDPEQRVAAMAKPDETGSRYDIEPAEIVHDVEGSVRLIRVAEQSPEDEERDLQVLQRAMWRVANTEQKRSFLSAPEVLETVARLVGQDEQLMTLGEIDGLAPDYWQEACDSFGLDTSDVYADEAIVEIINAHRFELYVKAYYVWCEGDCQNKTGDLAEAEKWCLQFIADGRSSYVVDEHSNEVFNPPIDMKARMVKCLKNAVDLHVQNEGPQAGIDDMKSLLRSLWVQMDSREKQEFMCSDAVMAIVVRRNDPEVSRLVEQATTGDQLNLSQSLELVLDCAERLRIGHPRQVELDGLMSLLHPMSMVVELYTWRQRGAWFKFLAMDSVRSVMREATGIELVTADGLADVAQEEWAEVSEMFNLQTNVFHPVQQQVEYVNALRCEALRVGEHQVETSYESPRG